MGHVIYKRLYTIHCSLVVLSLVNKAVTVKSQVQNKRQPYVVAHSRDDSAQGRCGEPDQ